MRHLFVVISLSLVSAAGAAPPEVSFTAAGLEIRTSAGGSIAIVSRMIEEHNQAPLLRQYKASHSDEDRDGIIRVPLTGQVPERSVWVVIDMRTGEWTARAPGAAPRQLNIRTPREIIRSVNGKETAELDRDYLDVTLVRPGSGLWSLEIMDGGSLDDDKMPNGRARVGIADLKAIGTSPAVGKIGRDDLAILFDVRTLDYFVLAAGAR